MRKETKPSLTILSDQGPSALVKGSWLIDMLAENGHMQALHQQLLELQHHPNLQWDLRQLNSLDHIGAQLLWVSWNRQFPDNIQLHDTHKILFERLAHVQALPIPKVQKSKQLPFGRLGLLALNFALHVVAIIELLGQLVLDLGRLIRHPLQGPWKEISANVYRTGFQALAITALVGLLIGVVLSYLTGQQLKNYGGDLFIVNLLGISIIRELGPMLAAILIAGRSGSAITAQLGVMRVTEELDAMRVMGIPVGFRLIMPKVIALTITMPLIIIWTDVMALIGGALSAQVILDMSPGYFLHKLPEAVSLANYWIGLSKGIVFGLLIGLVACHYGLRIKPNTESLGLGTTSSVVVSITTVIIADAFFAILFSKVPY
ncbi:MlaE family ABC transporter permease [Undibacterium fentianense]|uniref:ABC transporter permease n=1 Tax=Undibacterium fentianense TaxID=2828728 RepID=A0A941IF07_9BURK|nr:ABC transporter permease [Undibacterium fentianense]MBR7801693.1 ABC transporter permease [Undibacterium fentianense]